jgi:hypothetical protein
LRRDQKWFQKPWLLPIPCTGAAPNQTLKNWFLADTRLEFALLVLPPALQRKCRDQNHVFQVRNWSQCLRWSDCGRWRAYHRHHILIYSGRFVAHSLSRLIFADVPQHSHATVRSTRNRRIAISNCAICSISDWGRRLSMKHPHICQFFPRLPNDSQILQRCPGSAAIGIFVNLAIEGHSPASVANAPMRIWIRRSE